MTTMLPAAGLPSCLNTIIVGSPLKLAGCLVSGYHFQSSFLLSSDGITISLVGTRQMVPHQTNGTHTRQMVLIPDKWYPTRQMVPIPDKWYSYQTNGTPPDKWYPTRLIVPIPDKKYPYQTNGYGYHLSGMGTICLVGYHLETLLTLSTHAREGLVILSVYLSCSNFGDY